MKHVPPKEVMAMNAEQFYQSDLVIDATGSLERNNISDKTTISGIFKGMVK